MSLSSNSSSQNYSHFVCNTENCVMQKSKKKKNYFGSESVHTEKQTASLLRLFYSENISPLQ